MDPAGTCKKWCCKSVTTGVDEIVGEPGEDGDGHPLVAVDVLNIVNEEHADEAPTPPYKDPNSLLSELHEEHHRRT